jgi:hypothetical protein
MQLWGIVCDPDGKGNVDEFDSKAFFEKCDINRDGELSKEELALALKEWLHEGTSNRFHLSSPIFIPATAFISDLHLPLALSLPPFHSHPPSHPHPHPHRCASYIYEGASTIVAQQMIDMLDTEKLGTLSLLTMERGLLKMERSQWHGAGKRRITHLQSQDSDAGSASDTGSTR